MNAPCLSPMADEGEHRLQYRETINGEVWYVCLNANCGETIIEYIENHGC